MLLMSGMVVMQLKNTSLNEPSDPDRKVPTNSAWGAFAMLCAAAAPRARSLAPLACAG